VLDRKTLWLTLTLSVVGLLAVADASAPQALRVFSDPYYFTKQQLLWTALGLAALFGASLVHYSVWRKIAYPLFFAALLALVAVLVPGVGSKVLGARRWISIGQFGFQPSEPAKLGMAILFAKLYVDKKPFYYFVAALLAVSALVMLQPDLGTTIVITGVAFVQLFVMGWSVFDLLGLLLGGTAAGAVLVFSSSYRRQRVMSFLGSTADPLGSSYHIRQVLIALGSGGIFGVGLGQSRQKHLFLPESATDSVFAVIAEEVGFVGGGAVIILLFYLLLRLFAIARGAPDDFSKVLGAGIASWIGVQIFLNLSSMVSLTPLTGIPLPFFSYGGTSLTTMLGSIGILLNISRHRYAQKEKKRRKTRR